MQTIELDLDAYLRGKAYRLRSHVIEMVFSGGSGHPGGSLSVADIVATLYWHVMRIDPERPHWPERDRLVLSKGHAAPIVYAALAERGYFPIDVLPTLRKTGTILQGHPDMRKTPGIDMTSGSLGQGLSVALGIALGSRHLHRKFDVYALLSDGELQEGMIWEAAMAAAHYGAGNLTAIVDCNGLQVDGLVRDVMNIEPLADKWRAFGWRVLEVDGHDFAALRAAFDRRRAETGSEPWVFLCHTVKGKGVSFMEGVMEWHASPINVALRDQALAELAPFAEPR